MPAAVQRANRLQKDCQETRPQGNTQAAKVAQPEFIRKSKRAQGAFGRIVFTIF
jgi:hypothetical protein